MESDAEQNGKKHHIDADGKYDFQRRQPHIPKRGWGGCLYIFIRYGAGCLLGGMVLVCVGRSFTGVIFACVEACPADQQASKAQEKRQIKTQHKNIPVHAGISGERPDISDEKHGTYKRAERQKPICGPLGKDAFFIKVPYKNRAYGKTGG